MSERAKIGGKIVLEGESEYKQALKNIQTAQKELRSEMNLATAEFDGQQNSVEALTSKQEILSKQVEVASQKEEIYAQKIEEAKKKRDEALDTMDTTARAYDIQKQKVEDLTQTYGADSEEVKIAQGALQNLGTDLQNDTAKYVNAQNAVNDFTTQENNAKTATMKASKELETNNKYLDEAKSSAKGTATSIDQYGKSVKDATEKTSTFGEVFKGAFLANIATDALSKVADLAKQAGSALLDAGKSAAAYADDILTLSTQTGIATDTLQEYKYMNGLLDVDLTTITGSMAKLTKNMTSSSETVAAAFDTLGVKVRDNNGDLKSNQDVFYECIDALGKMTNETERDSTAMQIFGKKAQDLNPMIEAGSDKLKEFASEAHNMGYVLDEDTLEALGKTQDSFDRLTAAGEAIKNKVGAEVAPVMADFADQITDNSGEIADGLSDLVKNVIPPVTTALNFLIDNKDQILAVGSGLATSVLTFGAASKTAGVLITAFASDTEAATAAVNPWLAAISAALGVAMTIWSQYQSSTDGVVDKIVKNADEAVKAVPVTSTQITQIENLKTKIEALNSVETLNTSQKADLRLAVAQLNDILPDLNLQIDDNTGKLKENNDELERNVDDAVAAYRAQKNAEEAADIVQQLSDVEQEQIEIEDQMSEHKQTMAEYQDKVNESLKNGTDQADYYTVAMGDEETQISTLQEQHDRLTDSAEALRSKYEELTGGIDSVTEASSGISGAMDSSKTAMEDNTEAADEMSEEEAKAAEEIQKKWEECRQSAESSLGGTGASFEKLKEDSALSLSQMAENLSANAKAYQDYADNATAAIEYAAKNPAYQDLLDSILDMGINGAAYLQEFVDSANGKSDSLSTVMKDFGKMTEAKEDATQVLTDWHAAYDEGLTGINDIVSTKNDEIKQTRDEANTTRNTDQKTSDDEYIEQTKTAYSDVTEATQTGIEDVKTVVSDQQQSLYDTLYQAIQYTMDAAKVALVIGDDGRSMRMYSLGTTMMNSLADGITKGTGTVKSALQNALNSAINSLSLESLTSKIDKALGSALGG